MVILRSDLLDGYSGPAEDTVAYGANLAATAGGGKLFITPPVSQVTAPEVAVSSVTPSVVRETGSGGLDAPATVDDTHAAIAAQVRAFLNDTPVVTAVPTATTPAAPGQPTAPAGKRSLAIGAVIGVVILVLVILWAVRR